MERLKTIDLSAIEKWAIIAQVLLRTDALTMKTQWGGISEVQKVFHDRYSVRTIHRVKEQYRGAIDAGNFTPDLSLNKIGVVGAKSELDEELAEMIKELNNDTKRILSVRALARAVSESRFHIPYSTMYQHCLRLGCFNHGSYIKPLLIVEHRIKRLRCASIVMMKKQVSF